MKFPTVSLALALVLLSAWTGTAAPVVTERWGTHATADHQVAVQHISVLENYPTYNDPAKLLFGDHNGGRKWALLAFDLTGLPPGAVIRSARLRLRLYAYSPALDRFEAIRPVADPDGLGAWSPTEATFAQRRNGVPWSHAGNGDLNTALGPADGSSYLYYVPQYQSRWREWDVTATVRAWAAGTLPNRGLALPWVEGGLYESPRADDPDPAARPVLEITYEEENPNRPPQPTGVRAIHRAGQTFLTWQDVASPATEISYRVYRHTSPITAQTLDQAERLAEVGPDAAAYRREAAQCPGGANCSPINQSRFVIEDDGAPLPTGTGLYVHTAPEAGPVSAYYAVTTVVEGNENRDDFANNATDAVSESASTPRPVRVWTAPGGNGWVYTQFMGDQDWNPNLEGAAYNFYVGTPPSYSETGAPSGLMMVLHAWGGNYGTFMPAGGSSYWDGVLVLPDDRLLTWWFGFNEFYGNPDRRFADGRIVDYTHQRLDAMLDFVLGEFNVDPARVSAQGGSMGGSGVVNYALRRGDRFAAVFAESAMTDYARAGAAGGTAWETGAVTQYWGTVAQNLPTNLGMSIWDWYDLTTWVRAHPAVELPWLSDHHGKADEVIDWETQGRPWTPALEAGRRPFAAEFDATDHGCACVRDVAPGLDHYACRVSRDEPLPALGEASNSQDPATAYGCRNCRIAWSSSWNNFAGAPVDTPSRFEMVFRTTDGAEATVDVTPRRLRQFVIAAGASCRWTNQPLAGGAGLTGEATADANGLLTVPQCRVSPTGNRLILEPAGAALPAPVVSAVAPASGPTAGGTAIRLSGSGFQAGATVSVGEAAAGDVNVLDEGQLTAITGASTTAGSCSVRVTNPDGQSGTLAGGFTYTASPVFTGQDALSLGSVTTGSATVEVPVYLMDAADTALGPGQTDKLRAFAFRVVYDYAGTGADPVSSLTVIRAGVCAALAPLYEASTSQGRSSAYLAVFSSLPLAENAPAPGDLVARIVMNMNSAWDVGVSVQLSLDPDPALTVLSNSAGSVTETSASGTLGLSDGGAVFNTPLLVTLLSFTAIPANGGIDLDWETACEIEHAGFDLWREEASPKSLPVRVNPALIPAAGDPLAGAVYHYLDDAVAPGVTYRYTLAAVDRWGQIEYFGPVTAQLPNPDETTSPPPLFPERRALAREVQ